MAGILGRGSGSHGLWQRMSGPDRRHAVGVARRVVATLGPAAVPSPVLAAALLHDVGKVESGLGTLARVPATVIGMAGGRDRAPRWASRPRGPRRRLGLYLTHTDIGADLLSRAGADPLTVAWAREHHRSPASWTVDRHVADALKAADDD